MDETTAVADTCESIEIALAVLNVWTASVQGSAPMDQTGAATFQVSASAVWDLLDEASEGGIGHEGASLDFIAGHALVQSLDYALWNFMSGTVRSAPTAAQLAATAQLASKRLSWALNIMMPRPAEVFHA